MIRDLFLHLMDRVEAFAAWYETYLRSDERKLYYVLCPEERETLGHW